MGTSYIWLDGMEEVVVGTILYKSEILMHYKED